MEDLTQRTLRELLTLARERLGPAASKLKTRDELLAALSGEPLPLPSEPVAAKPAPEIVTRDFFRRRP